MTAPALSQPPHAKLEGGVWLPETETHFVEWMRHSKRARVIEGKRTYQHHKVEAEMLHQPKDRRRVALDIGAHVGLWAMWMVWMFDFVEAFEPVPLFYDIFPFNVDMECCTLHLHALGDAPGTISITVPREQTGGAHVTARDPVNVKYNPSGKSDTWHEIPVVTLDSLHFETVDFIKIDVEGWEPRVLRGGEAMIRTCRPNIIVECKGNDTAYGEARNAAVTLLESWGMRQLQVISGDFIMGWPT